MRIILSRKGFDSSSGGMPSPILPDGTLLSMPIPSDDAVKYCELDYKGKKYSEVIKELKPNFKYEFCHLDPDIRGNCGLRCNDWLPAFGQAGAALSHLNNHDVKEGDLFLYFGWFKQTEYDNTGKLRFVKSAPDIHVIYGYLQVGKVLRNWDEIQNISWHPHADSRRKKDRLNAIYLASEKLLNFDYPGFGVLDYSENLVLTKIGESRSHWLLPKCLVGKEISYHKPSNYKDGYFQSAMRGQEFVVEADDQILNWVHSILIK